MEELKVGQVIISKQKEDSENFQKFVQIAKDRNIKVKIVEEGNKLFFERNLSMEILWPTRELEISENPLNNNSIVGKLEYKNFSMLFTGDIEEIAERALLEKYSGNLKKLQSTVLKVAHHGSKTSSNYSLLEAVKPSLAVIGVGKNNNFGHPSEITLNNLKNINCVVYRTDTDGEIKIETDGKKIKVNKHK